jgi:hypothetical protein
MKEVASAGHAISPQRPPTAQRDTKAAIPRFGDCLVFFVLFLVKPVLRLQWNRRQKRRETP